MKTLRKLISLILLGGAVASACCSHLRPVRNDGTVMDQHYVIYTIWTEGFGRTDQHPSVIWHTGAELNCTDPNSGKPGFWIVDQHLAYCREGATWVPYQVEVAWTGLDKFSSTALVHELWHAALMREGILDPFHRLGGFGPGGIVDRVNSRLSEQGF